MYTLSLTTQEYAKKKKHLSEEPNNVSLTCLAKINNILIIRNPILMTELIKIQPTTIHNYLDYIRIHEDMNYLGLLGFRMVFKREGSKTCL